MHTDRPTSGPDSSYADLAAWVDELLARRDGFTYVVQAGDIGPVKIGRTYAVDPRERIRDLQTACPFTLHLRFLFVDPEEERNLHEIFAPLRLRGEWFEPKIVLEWLGDTQPKNVAAAQRARLWNGL